LHAENLKKQHSKRLFHTGFVSSPNEVERIRATCKYLDVSMIGSYECPDYIGITTVYIF
jgi:hypothetical protein